MDCTKDDIWSIESAVESLVSHIKNLKQFDLVELKKSFQNLLTSPLWIVNSFPGNDQKFNIEISSNSSTNVFIGFWFSINDNSIQISFPEKEDPLNPQWHEFKLCQLQNNLNKFQESLSHIFRCSINFSQKM